MDNDFTKDDLGGHCNGLGAAFNPKAQFVCCRENPELHPPKDNVLASSTSIEEDNLHEVVIEATSEKTTTEIVTSVVTEQVTEIITEIEPVTEVVMVTEINPVTQEELRPGIVLDDVIETNIEYEDNNAGDDCLSATLLGLECDQQLPKKAERLDDQPEFVFMSSSATDEQEAMDEEAIAEEEFELIDNEQELGLIQTFPNNLTPDRDDTFESIVATQEKLVLPSATNNAAGLPANLEGELKLIMR